MSYSFKIHLNALFFYFIIIILKLVLLIFTRKYALFYIYVRVHCIEFGVVFFLQFCVFFFSQFHSLIRGEIWNTWCKFVWYVIFWNRHLNGINKTHRTKHAVELKWVRYLYKYFKQIIGEIYEHVLHKRTFKLRGVYFW